MTVVAVWEEIARVLPQIDLVTAIKEGFLALAGGRAEAPPPGELLLPRGEAHIKYAYIAGDDSFVLKVATGFYDNPVVGQPSSNGLFVLFDAAHGRSLAVLLDEGRLTDLRTAIAGAVAAEYLAPQTVAAIGVIGTGTQAELQVRELGAVTPCRRIVVYGRDPARTAAYRARMEAAGYELALAASPAEVAGRANLIVTATPARAPLLMADDVRPGTHITAVGADSPDKNEIDPALLAKADLVVADSLAQCRARGEIHHALGRLGDRFVPELGAVIAGDVRGRTGEDQITLADLTGVAVQDVKIAQAVFAALRKNREAA